MVLLRRTHEESASPFLGSMSFVSRAHGQSAATAIPRTRGGGFGRKRRRRRHNGPQLVVLAGVSLVLVEIQNTYSLPIRALPHQTRRLLGLCWM